jgi:hypothetical protein
VTLHSLEIRSIVNLLGADLSDFFFLKTATLHSLEIRSLAEKICQHPIWVDLKGKDSVPETVYHLVVEVDSQFFLWI